MRYFLIYKYVTSDNVQTNAEWGHSSKSCLYMNEHEKDIFKKKLHVLAFIKKEDVMEKRANNYLTI